jgi:ankyrin repeat protein
VKQGQLPRVKYLIDCGADVDYEDTGAPLLSHAVRHGRVEIVKMLILAGADVNRKDSLEHQAIHEAASSKTNEAFAILGLLLWAGCEFKVKGFFGETPLHKAASGRIAKALIQAGADIESKIESVMSNRSGDGFTPLHEHARKGRIDIVKILIEAGANINARDGEGTTPLGGCLSLTRTEDRASTIAFLRAHGARE